MDWWVQLSYHSNIFYDTFFKEESKNPEDESEKSDFDDSYESDSSFSSGSENGYTKCNEDKGNELRMNQVLIENLREAEEKKKTRWDSKTL